MIYDRNYDTKIKKAALLIFYELFCPSIIFDLSFSNEDNLAYRDRHIFKSINL